MRLVCLIAALILSATSALADARSSAKFQTAPDAKPVRKHPGFPAQFRQCGDHAEFVEILTDRWNEARVGGGLRNGQQMFEVWVSAQGTWTLLFVTPQGAACVAASGQYWREFDRPPEGAGS